MRRKRGEPQGFPSKRQKHSQSSQPSWPHHFQELYRIFKAINTVLAFVSSRKQLATTFSVIRSSAENLLKHPIDLASVAELKTILPNLIKFSFIPRTELQVIEDSTPGLNNISKEGYAAADADEHVLVLEFVDNVRGKKINGDNLISTPAMQPAAVKKLVEKRNKIFEQAVDQFIEATPGSQDPTETLKLTASIYVPAEPLQASCSDMKYKRVPDHDTRPSINSAITELEEQASFEGRIVYRHTFEARKAQTASFENVPEPIIDALMASCNISALYTHQHRAIKAIMRGRHVIVSTSTASGKSVIYEVPVLNFLLNDPAATAMFIYPTKALAQDQKSVMEKLLSSCHGLQCHEVATYDGDTHMDLRQGIRENASIVFTNFDMIHASVLPHEELWRSFLRNLKVLVVDELHYYSGIFGSHVAQILRRLRRVCAAVGNHELRFVSCSATIADPGAHMSQLFGISISDVEVVTEDGSPSGQKDFLVWHPPLVDSNTPSLGHHSPISEATSLMRFLMKRGIRVILFCKYRKVCEIAMKTIRADLSSEGRYDILEKTMAYRGGYSREDRRKIEQHAFNGGLLGIVGTNALELGIDIGVLDAVIMLGFPMNIASFRQQAGRAGRRSRDSLAVFVADFIPVDQHYVDHPQELFDHTFDDLVVDLENRSLLEAHLQCAAHEMPLSIRDEVYFGPQFKEICEIHLIKDHEGWYHTHPQFLPSPFKQIQIRGAQEEKYAVIKMTKLDGKGVDGSILEEVELSRAMFEIYEGGVFLHQGFTYIVKEVSHDSKLARVIQADVNWVTSPRDYTNVDALETHRIKKIKDSPELAYYGKIKIVVKVFGFFKLRKNVVLEAVDLETPTWKRESTGLWIDIPSSLLQLFRAKGINPAEAIHSAQHLILNRFPMGRDIKTECKAPEKEYKASSSQRRRPARLIFYDTLEGGLTVKAFDTMSELLRKSFDAVEACRCDKGCINCVHSPACKEGNLVCSKLGAQFILRSLLGLHIDADSLPYQGDITDNNTIVEATATNSRRNIKLELY